MGNTSTIPFTRKSTNKQNEPHSPKNASRTPFGQYDPVISTGVLEPGTGITGISVNEKSNYQSYFNQITGTQKFPSGQPQAIIQYTGPNHALDMELLGQQSVAQMNEKMNPYRANGSQDNVYQNQQINNKSSEVSYGRQNSDQTQYMRNMRSVLHHNGLQ